MVSAEQVQSVKERESGWLLRQAGVWSVSADGRDDQGQPVLKIGLDAAHPDTPGLIRARITDCPIQFEAVGPIQKLPAQAQTSG